MDCISSNRNALFLFVSSLESLTPIAESFFSLALPMQIMLITRGPITAPLPASSPPAIMMGLTLGNALSVDDNEVVDRPDARVRDLKLAVLYVELLDVRVVVVRLEDQADQLPRQL